MMSFLIELTKATLGLLSIMAPYMLLGFAISCVLYRYLPAEWVVRHLGREGWRQIVKAALIGVPLPLCSCGVLPVALSLRQAGAGYSATVSFLTATPQVGVSSVLTTYSLLGPVMTVARVLGAFVSGVVGGLLVLLTGRRPRAAADEGGGGVQGAGVTEAVPSRTWRDALTFATRRLPYGVAVPFLIGVVLSALLTLVTPPDFFARHLPGGIWNYLVMMLIGIPLYTCSNGAIPIAAWLVYSGMSPGEAMVFLMTGPATSGAVILTLLKVLGRAVVGCYLLAIACCSLATGLIIDLLFSGVAAARIPAYLQEAEACCASAPVLSWVAVALLLLLFVYARLPRRPTPPAKDIKP